MNNIKQAVNFIRKIKTKSIMIFIIIVTIMLCIISIPIGIDMQYNGAIKDFEAGNYVAAYKIFDKFDGYRDSEEKKKDCIYGQALKAVKKKKYIKAYKLFMRIEDYGDTKEQMKAIYSDYKNEQVSLIKTAKEGDVIVFGEYDGKQIEWIVLNVNKKKNKSLVISKNVLFNKSFDSKHNVTWDKSEIRKWLNDTFYKSISEGFEKNVILTSKLNNKKNAEFKTSSGKNTKDKIFLLSVEETDKYFKTDASRICNDLEGISSHWYLRTQGDASYRVTYVDTSGTIDASGTAEEYEKGIRPAMWITIK